MNWEANGSETVPSSREKVYNFEKQTELPSSHEFQQFHLPPLTSTRQTKEEICKEPLASEQYELYSKQSRIERRRRHKEREKRRRAKEAIDEQDTGNQPMELASFAVEQDGISQGNTPERGRGLNMERVQYANTANAQIASTSYIVNEQNDTSYEHQKKKNKKNKEKKRHKNNKKDKRHKENKIGILHEETTEVLPMTHT